MSATSNESYVIIIESVTPETCHMQQTLKNLINYFQNSPLYIDDPDSNNILVFDMSLIDIEEVKIFFKVTLDEWDNLSVVKGWVDTVYGKLFYIKESNVLGNANQVLDFLDEHVSTNGSVYERKTFFTSLMDLKNLVKDQ